MKNLIGKQDITLYKLDSLRNTCFCSKFARSGNRDWRKVEAHNLCGTAAGDFNGGFAKMTLQMQDAFPCNIAQPIQLQSVKRRFSVQKARDIVEVAGRMNRRDLVPPRAVKQMSGVRLLA